MSLSLLALKKFWTIFCTGPLFSEELHKEQISIRFDTYKCVITKLYETSCLISSQLFPGDKSSLTGVNEAGKSLQLALEFVGRISAWASQEPLLTMSFEGMTCVDQEKNTVFL